MNWLSGFANPIERDVPLGELTWYRIGGRARYLSRPDNESELERLVRRAAEQGVELKILGRGANVLVRDDGFDGVVVRLDTPAFQRTEVDGERVRVGAGVDLMRLAKRISHSGLSGLECMAGIPGTIGGAVRMNAGGRFGCIGDVIERCRLLDGSGVIETWSKDRLAFDYRSSAIGDRVVLSADLRLRRSDRAETRRRFEEIFASKTASQPISERSAGCVFKNPVGASAGALIDAAGLKGSRCGGAVVSQRHANFICADPSAKASDVERLAGMIAERVRAEYGTELELEIDIW